MATLRCACKNAPNSCESFWAKRPRARIDFLRAERVDFLANPRILRPSLGFHAWFSVVPLFWSMQIADNECLNSGTPFQRTNMNFILRISLSALFGLCCVATTVAQEEPSAGLDTTSFNRDVRPQDDIYEFVNGTWLKNTPIPSDKSNYGSFSKLSLIHI